MEHKNIEERAAEFIKKCHVLNGVYAIEGGVINLDSLLIDFVKECNRDKKIDHQMLDEKEVLNNKIIDVHLHHDSDGDELQLQLDNGKQIEISLHDEGYVLVQSD